MDLERFLGEPRRRNSAFLTGIPRRMPWREGPLFDDLALLPLATSFELDAM
ncbi:hypothetical protein F2Q70_00031265 [Brassica cretica]|uniref:Uncharacterized protein n=1 Tax=Brassica cretica TaxID=69181 RepID=A0A8S9FRW5_BRACR|nr:hypothetical protein F2Q70_00031265 [Brassica cretica]